MELSSEQYKSIQHFLEGKMSAAEEARFMQQVEQNKLLQEYLQFEFEIRANLQSSGKQKMSLYFENEIDPIPFDHAGVRNLIDKAGTDWVNEQKKKSPARLISIKSWLAIAASIIVAIGIFWISFKKSKNQEVATGNKKNEARKDSSINITRVDTLNKIEEPGINIDYAAILKKYYTKDKAPRKKPDLLAQALTDYNKSYYNTIQDFDLVNLPQRRGDEGKNDINNTRYVRELGYYYKGLSYIESKNEAKALSNLKWLTKNAKNEELLVKAQWYQALVYINQKNDSMAIPMLRFVANSKSASYSKKAKEVLQLLGQ